MFLLTVKPHRHPVQVTTRFRGSDKVAIIVLRPGEVRDFEVSSEIEREFEEVPASEAPLLGTRAGEEPVPVTLDVTVWPVPASLEPYSTCDANRPDAGRSLTVPVTGGGPSLAG